MKLCKDCRLYTPKRFVIFNERLSRSPEWCAKKIGDPNPVSGEFVRAGDPTAAREDEQMCGRSARWFIAGTLDGRLAALEDAAPAQENQVSHSGD